MTVIFVLLLIGAVICFALSAFGVTVRQNRPVNLVALGLFLWALVELIRAIVRLD